MKEMNKYNPNIHHRRSIRLKGYDYSQAGLYFVTICCQKRACLFGEIINGEMVLNDAGKIANQCWLEIPNHFPDAKLLEHIIMPNHIHGIIELAEAEKKSPDNTTNTIPENNNDNIGAKNISHENNVENIGAKNISHENNNDNNGTKNISHENNVENIGAKNISPLQSPSKTIGSIVRGFKIGVTKWMRQNTDIYDVWQRNYYEHIIRNEQSYQNISQYIINNPAKWNDDKFYKI